MSGSKILKFPHCSMKKRPFFRKKEFYYNRSYYFLQQMSMVPFVNYYVIILLQLAAIAIAVQINEREEKQIVLFDIASLLQ